MAQERKGDSQKLKMLYLVRIFTEETDDDHGLTIQQIGEKLAAYGANANRKTLYTDLEELQNYGLDIIPEQNGRNVYYHLGSRDFELPELKLLVDSVQSAKFITDRKSAELIRKLESLASKYDAKKLHRHVSIAGRVKTMNESVYYNVDRVQEAILEDKKIRFRYWRWNVKKQMELRRDGAWYVVSPWELMWDNENYYLVAFDSLDQRIKHFRVDKMLRISTLDEARDGKKEFSGFSMPKYSKSLFSVYGGEEMNVTIEARNDMVGVLIDRFGKDIIINPKDAEHFEVSVRVAVSNPFLGWIISLGEGVRITGPETVVERMREEVRRLKGQYGV
ncbi:MAG: WYL domain-containing protein [Clostridia bacterium]|nr:WYL domain-containing protein [Clostridia bacterium]